MPPAIPWTVRSASSYGALSIRLSQPHNAVMQGEVVCRCCFPCMSDDSFCRVTSTSLVCTCADHPRPRMGTKHQKRKSAEAASGAPAGQAQGLADLADVASMLTPGMFPACLKQKADQFSDNTLPGSASC